MENKLPLHKEVVKFWSLNGKELNSKLINTTSSGGIMVYYHGACDYGGYPPINNIIAFEFKDGSITYRLNNTNYKEPQILRLIKLKSFI